MTFKDLRQFLVATPLYIGWRPNVQAMQGERRTRFKGEGGEYTDVRVLQPGDEMGRINWKLRAKDRTKFYVDVPESEVKVTVTVIVDVSTSMFYGTQWLNQMELAAILCGSLFASAACTKDLGRLITYDGRQVRAGRPKDAARLLPEAMVKLLRTGEFPAAQTANDGQSPRGGLAHALSCLSKQRQLVCVVSNFKGLSEADKRALRRAGAAQHLVCFAVHDLRQAELPAAPLCGWLPIPGVYEIEDDNGILHSVRASAKDRQVHAERFRRRQEELQALWQECHCRWCGFVTSETPDELKKHLTKVLKSQRRVGSLDAKEGSP